MYVCMKSRQFTEMLIANIDDELKIAQLAVWLTWGVWIPLFPPFYLLVFLYSGSNRRYDDDDDVAATDRDEQSSKVAWFD